MAVILLFRHLYDFGFVFVLFLVSLFCSFECVLVYLWCVCVSWLCYFGGWVEFDVLGLCVAYLVWFGWADCLFEVEGLVIWVFGLIEYDWLCGDEFIFVNLWFRSFDLAVCLWFCFGLCFSWRLVLLSSGCFVLNDLLCLVFPLGVEFDLVNNVDWFWLV